MLPHYRPYSSPPPNPIFLRQKPHTFPVCACLLSKWVLIQMPIPIKGKLLPGMPGMLGRGELFKATFAPRRYAPLAT